MNILMISHEYPPAGGGGAGACRALATEFAAAGNRVHVLTVRYGNTTEHENDGRMTVTRLPAKRRSADSSSAVEMADYLLKAERAAKRLLAAETFDICICFFGIPGGVLAHRLKEKYGLQYIIRMGGGDIPGFQNRFKTLYSLTGPALRRIWRDAAALVANSEGLRELALGFCSKYPVEVIPNGVDTALYHPADVRETMPEDPVRLLTVCRLIERKGIQDLIPHIKSIEEKTGRHIRWIIAGDGPYRDALEKTASEYGVTDRLVFAGHTARERTAELYRRSDIFIFPSHKEGMPNAVLEAMASGLPILMRRDCQGAAELIRDNGSLADSGAGLAGALAAMISLGGDEWGKMGRESRRIAVEEYQWRYTAEKYMEIINKANISG